MVQTKSLMVAAALAMMMAVGTQASVYSNSCDSLAEWNDNSSGTMTIQSGGPSGTYLHFVGNGGATITLRPNITTGTVGADVKAGDKLVFDAKGVANDFSVDFSDRNTWTNYKLTGTAGNQWVYLGPDWTHFELTIPADVLADYVSFNVYASGQEINLDNVSFVPEPITLSLLGTMGMYLVSRRRR